MTLGQLQSSYGELWGDWYNICIRIGADQSEAGLPCLPANERAGQCHVTVMQGMQGQGAQSTRHISGLKTPLYCTFITSHETLSDWVLIWCMQEEDVLWWKMWKKKTRQSRMFVIIFGILHWYAVHKCMLYLRSKCVIIINFKFI